jgi:hypothetical protein
MPLPLVRWCLQLIVMTPLVAPLPLLILLTILRLLSANAFPPVGHLFASWLSCHPCCCAAATSRPLNTPPLTLVLSTRRFHLATSCLCLATRCLLFVCWRLSSCLPLFPQLVVTSHLIAPPPQVSILDPCLHSHRLVVASHLVIGRLYSVQYKGIFGAPDKGQTLHV